MIFDDKMNKNYTISDLSPHLFWDVDKSKLSLEKSGHYIIERIALLGGLKDWLIIRNIYGDSKLKEVIVNMRYLDDKSLHFYAQVFNIPKNNFRCYKLKQSNLRPSPYWKS